ncbi:small membrane A-kinase anchor protein-like [Conger conger]|uniref:small membrane A-kinase anchor protein-like n=1 Tax=Conger conger TaxID=82655 RepID=UPI002A59864C|nr:small membrane A-kinase anchor protein-like [Conger conger]
MGCIKSKHRDAVQGACSLRSANRNPGKGTRAERVALINADMGPEEEPLAVDPALLDYAQRLSEDIVARAVQQWAEVDSRYSDIPYIECDVP